MGISEATVFLAEGAELPVQRHCGQIFSSCVSQVHRVYGRSQAYNGLVKIF